MMRELIALATVTALSLACGARGVSPDAGGPTISRDVRIEGEMLIRLGERVIWEDARTRFELVRDPERSVATVFGILSDRRSGG